MPRRLSEHLVDAGGEPVVAVRLGRLGQALAHDEHVVVRRWHTLEPRAHELAQLALDSIPDDGVPDRLRHGEAEARIADRLLALEPVERQEARRDGPAVAVDGVEVARAGEAVPALHRLTPRGACDPWRGGA